MARVGSFVVGDGTKVGRGPLTVEQQAHFDVLAGVSPSYPGRHVPIRVRCAGIWSFNPETWLPVAKLPYLNLAEAVHSGQLVEPGFQQDELTFTVLDIGNYYSVTNHNLVENGAWLCVRWTVATPGASVTQLGGVFRVTTDPSKELRGVGGRLEVRAIDYGQYQFERYAFPGVATFAQLEDYRTAWMASPGPYFTDAFSFIPVDDAAIGNTLAGALLQNTGQRFRTKAWPTYAIEWIVPDVTIGPGEVSLAPVSLLLGEVGKPSTFYDFLRKMWTLIGGFWLTYAADGYLELRRGGNFISDSGAYVTCGSTKLGAEPLPWATPMNRRKSRPEFDQVSYFVRRDSNPTPPAEGAGGAGEGGLIPSGYAASRSAAHPEGSSIRGTEEVIDQIPWFGADINHTFQAFAFEGWDAWAEYRLRQHLGQADTVEFLVDPAYPPPMARLVRVNMPPTADGYYQLTGFSRPLAARKASWQLRWWRDA